ncbi:transposase [Nonomuraea terrae]|nr:transposase [Nonomuraea terrae]
MNTFARGKIGLRKIRRNWEGILRVVASVYTGHRPRLRRRHHAPA